MKYSCAKPSTSRNASPYHSDDPGRWTVGRWPRRSPPRGLNRGVGLGPAISSLCSYRFLFFELEPVRRTIHDNGVAFAEIAQTSSAFAPPVRTTWVLHTGTRVKRRDRWM